MNATGESLLFQVEVLRVAHDPDDPERALRSEGCRFTRQPRVEHRFPLREQRGERLVHDHDGLGRHRIAIVEVTSRDQRNPKRPEISAANARAQRC